MELSSQGVIEKRVDELESWFMIALDYMIQLADKDQGDQVYFLFFSLSTYNPWLFSLFLQRKSLLEIIRQTILDHFTKKYPQHVSLPSWKVKTQTKLMLWWLVGQYLKIWFFWRVQVIGLICGTPKNASRQELLRRVAASDGVFIGEQGTKIQLPMANLNDIAKYQLSWRFAWGIYFYVMMIVVL